MKHAPVDEDTRRFAASPKLRTFRKPLNGNVAPAGVVERVALGMIARHGAHAAREATIHLNRMIDRGDLAARDLWACVVHVIHERQE